MRTYHKIKTYLGFLRVFNKVHQNGKTLYFSIPNANTYYVCAVKQNGMVNYAYVGTQSIKSSSVSAILSSSISIWSK